MSIIYNIYEHHSNTYGISKNISSSVLIYGLDKGLATEVVKNLTTSCIENIYLYDNNIITDKDTETGYYYSKEDIGEKRKSILTKKLQELNPNTMISSVDNYKQNQTVTIVINQSVEVVQEISNYCRSENIKLIVLWSSGISGVVFVDAGDKHLIVDKTGDIIDPVQIGQITNTGIIQCAPNCSHDLKTNDVIIFNNLDGDNLKQFETEWTITVINETSFQLNNAKINLPFVFINGTANYIKKQSVINHVPINFNNSNDLIKTFIQLYSNNLINTMPPLWTNENDQFMMDHNICLKDHAKLFHHELINIVSIFGSIVSSETIKLLTNKYIPISQWFSWTDESLIPRTKPLNLDGIKTTYGLLYGLELENKLMESKWLLIGSGSIGCEHLKNLAFMNIKNVTITDYDIIDSNINNQFLFKTKDIGKHKSETASINSNKLCTGFNSTFCIDKMELDNPEFIDINLDELTGVLNTVNDITTKKYIDDQCFKYNLPSFNSSTHALSGKTLPVIPFITDTFSALNTIEKVKSYPMCVIKSFPIDIHHTIQWASEQFDFFSNAPNVMNQYMLNKSYIDTLEQNDKVLAQEYINLFTIKYPIHLKGLSMCVSWAIDMFNENFYNSINKLLESFPANHEVSEGVAFWSLGKRCPTPIKFDSTNTQHIEFIETTVQLLAKCCGISDEFELKDILKILSLSDTDTEYIKYEQTYVSQKLDVKWITIVSNMRACNYSIPNIDYNKVKNIVEKINPTVITTASMVSGLGLLEMLKYLIGCNDYKSSIINLVDTSIISSNPSIAPINEIGGIKVNSWTKFNYTKNTTLNEFKKYYENIFETIITMIVIDTTMIYADFLEQEVLEYNLLKILCDHFNCTTIPKNISFNLLSDDDKDIPIISINI